ncbi:MAG: glycoside hydrolase family 16 protein [Propionibacteriaceae bacterium]|nr:glycoside hydrolase family 16 protein [Propionibacteriaceae bacterium]
MNTGRRTALRWTGLGVVAAAGATLPLLGRRPAESLRPAPTEDGSLLLGRDRWTVQTGAGGWGNHELQTYTESAVRFTDDGGIRITAHVRGSGPEAVCTSGRITTAGRFSFTEGTLTARMTLPEGQGLLPAFWLLGDGLASAGWPACGEIDVVETPNTSDRSVHTLHGKKAHKQLAWHLGNTVEWATPLSRGHHEYTVKRRPGRVVILVDGRVVLDRTRSELGPKRWVFDEPFHVLLSLAVGGDWPGPPDASTPATSVLAVDRVRFTPGVEL